MPIFDRLVGDKWNRHFLETESTSLLFGFDCNQTARFAGVSNMVPPLQLDADGQLVLYKPLRAIQES